MTSHSDKYTCDVCGKKCEEIWQFTQYGWGNYYKGPRIKGKYCEAHFLELERKVLLNKNTQLQQHSQHQ